MKFKISHILGLADPTSIRGDGWSEMISCFRYPSTPLRVIALSLMMLYEINQSSAQPNAQSDLFNVLQNTCSNYLDASANDILDSITFQQLQIITQPANGSASVSPNGNYLSYCPQQGFLGADQFQYSVGDSLRSDTATVHINVLPPNNQINPGDADQNGKVENFDVLTIGLAYGTFGPSRADSFSNSSLAWSPLSFINSDPGASDCNGDGIVDTNDLSVIENNFSDTFGLPEPFEVDTSLCDTDGIPFYIQSLTSDSISDGDTLVISLRLGDDIELNEAYGIAFTLEFDNRFIPGNQVQLQTNNSWLLQNDGGLFFKKDSQLDGTIDVTLSKTNHNPANGGGEIMRAIVPIDDNIDGIAVAPGWHDLKLNLRTIRLISEYDILRDVCVEHPSIMVNKSATSVSTFKTNNFRLYPNPNDGKMTIEGDDLREIIVTDLLGKEIIITRLMGGRKIQLDLTKTVLRGNYFVTIKTSDSVFNHRILIQH